MIIAPLLAPKEDKFAVILKKIKKKLLRNWFAGVFKLLGHSVAHSVEFHIIILEYLISLTFNFNHNLRVSRKYYYDRRPSGDPLETSWRATCFIGDPS